LRDCRGLSFNLRAQQSVSRWLFSTSSTFLTSPLPCSSSGLFFLRLPTSRRTSLLPARKNYEIISTFSLFFLVFPLYPTLPFFVSKQPVTCYRQLTLLSQAATLRPRPVTVPAVRCLFSFFSSFVANPYPAIDAFGHRTAHFTQEGQRREEVMELDAR
jgi:hypothetical protein